MFSCRHRHRCRRLVVPVVVTIEKMESSWKSSHSAIDSKGPLLDADSSVFDYLRCLDRSTMDILYNGGKAEEYASRREHNSKWVCRAVLRSLPSVAQQFCLRLFHGTGSIERSDINKWVHERPESAQTRDDAMRCLQELHIVVPTIVENNKRKISHTNAPTFRESRSKVEMNAHFRFGLRCALACTSPAPWRDQLKKPHKPDKSPPGEAQISAEMHRKWDRVLNYLVRPQQPLHGIGHDVKKFLVNAGLIVQATIDDYDDQIEDAEDIEETDDSEGDGKRYRIGSKGWRFLLMDPQRQMWAFAQEFIDHDPNNASLSTAATSHGCIPLDVVLRFLFILSFCQVGQDYPVDVLDKQEMVLLDKFVELGFIYRRIRINGEPASRFYPTCVACNFASSKDTIESNNKNVNSNDAQNSFQILVQTNFQLIAYTESPLHIRMLGTFSECRAILPNALVCQITRESITRALEDGIKAQDILYFLETNAHSEARRVAQESRSRKQRRDSLEHLSHFSSDADLNLHTPFSNIRQSSHGLLSTFVEGEDTTAASQDISTVPATVKQQVLLWEKERNRMANPLLGTMHEFDDQISGTSFDAIVNALTERHLLIWFNKEKKRVIVQESPSIDTFHQTACGVIREVLTQSESH